MERQPYVEYLVKVAYLTKAYVGLHACHVVIFLALLTSPRLGIAKVKNAL